MNLFNLQIYPAGKVIVTENEFAKNGLILINGDIMSYKRLIEFQTKKYEDLDNERDKIRFD